MVYLIFKHGFFNFFFLMEITAHSVQKWADLDS